MAKYNLTEKKEKAAAYRKMVRAELVDQLYEKIVQKILVEKKYRDPDYSAKQLADELGTNTRYISAVISLRFNTNYSSMVNEYRIKDAMYMLIDKRFADLSMEEISDQVGFANRQSFYAAFYRLHQCSPRQYKLTHQIPSIKQEDEDAAKKDAEKKKEAEKKKKAAKKEAEKKKAAAKKEANKLKKAAKKEAEKIKAAAKKEADKVKKAAKKEAEKIKKAAKKAELKSK